MTFNQLFRQRQRIVTERSVLRRAEPAEVSGAEVSRSAPPLPLENTKRSFRQKARSKAKGCMEKSNPYN